MADAGLDLAAIKAALEEVGASWEAAPNPIAGLSPEERRARLGYVPEAAGELSLEAREQVAAQRSAEAGLAAAIGAPASFDWRNYGGQNYVTSVKDQGNCGSCVAFGVTASVETTLRVQQGTPTLDVNLSEASLWYCVAEALQGRVCPGGKPTSGWSMSPALNAFRDIGVPDDACFPYTAGDQACTQCSDWASRATKITGWHQITSVADMKTWLSTRGALGACFTVYDDFFGYTTGTYHHVWGNVAGGHCVCCVGYSDAGQFWICKNSWGSSWGESGFFCIGYGQCGIDAGMWAIDGVAIPITWQSNVTVSQTYASRDSQNAWAYFAGFGWRKIQPGTADGITNMLALFVEAKTKNKSVTVRMDGSAVYQAYLL
jgi:C1A family cysteine protease